MAFVNPTDNEQSFTQVEPPVPPQDDLNIIPSANGSILEGGSFQSPNYVPGVSGWKVDADGSAEFRDLTSNTQQLIRQFTAAENITVGQAVRAANYVSGGSIAYDNSAGGQSGGAVSTAFTVGSNVNRILILFVFVGSTGSGTAMGGTPTYAGIDFTLLTSQAHPSGDGEVHVFYLTSPTTGSNTLAIPESGDAMSYAVYSAYNAEQSVPAQYNVATASSAAVSISNTPTTAERMSFAGAIHRAGGTWSNRVNFNNNLEEIGFAAGTESSIAGRSLLLSTDPPVSLTHSADHSGAGAWAAVQVIVNSTTSPIPAVYLTSASSTTTSDGFIGFSKSAYSMDETADIIVAGTAPTTISLAAGNRYYLSNTNGVVSISAGTVTRKVGIAVSDTLLLITNIW